MKRSVAVGTVLAALAAMAAAQFGRGRRRGWMDPADAPRTAREIDSHSTGTPEWKNPPAHRRDVFTFARVIYSPNPDGWGRGGWTTDLPDADLNFSWRLQQMTSMKVDPDGRNIALTDPELPDYPFIYIVEPGGLYLSDTEAKILREYLLNGGFLMLDDFWGEYEWENCAEQLHKVFPDRKFRELELTHELYQRPFTIKSKGQVPNKELGVQSQYDGVTWERPDAQEVHHRVITDDKERIMVLACHNTDNGDGWEREGEDDYYFHNFSEKIAYPLGINIVFYVMTH